jgi:hypothetical protein
MHRTKDLALEALAATQHGVITRAQAATFGITDRMIHRRLTDHRWVRVHAGVYRLAAAPRTFRQRAAAASLWSDGLVSHCSGGRLWALEGVEGGQMHVTVGRVRSIADPRVVVHRSVDLLPADRHRVQGIAVTSPLRTIIDLAATLDATALEIAAEDALRRGLFTPGQLAWRFDGRGGRGVSGSAAMRDLLDRHLGDTDSGWEVRVAQHLVAGGLPTPSRQLRVTTSAGDRHVDLGYPGTPIVAIEYDSDRWHSGSARRHADAERRNLLRLAGCLVVEVTPDLVGRPDALVATVRAALDVRGGISNRSGTESNQEPRRCRTPWVP